MLSPERGSFRKAEGRWYRDFIYIYNFIGFVLFFCVYLKKILFFGRDLVLAIFYGWLNMKDPNFERKKKRACETHSK